MSSFFEYCARCGKMFQDEKKFHEHQNTFHRKPVPGVLPGKAKVQAKSVPVDQVLETEDSRLARTAELRDMKRKLKSAGIECATMNASDTEEAYREAQKQGIVE